MREFLLAADAQDASSFWQDLPLVITAEGVDDLCAAYYGSDIPLTLYLADDVEPARLYKLFEDYEGDLRVAAAEVQDSVLLSRFTSILVTPLRASYTTTPPEGQAPTFAQRIIRVKEIVREANV